ncbi:hypothetical protein ABZ858_00985 [Streptomyces sp. NPDC047017]|uniref:hypothetical protein n=1 Tax=Streptomyces sp. NPDC047017 TaxID=3155024 RepID=UPI0033E65EFA
MPFASQQYERLRAIGDRLAHPRPPSTKTWPYGGRPQGPSSKIIKWWITVE